MNVLPSRVLLVLCALLACPTGVAAGVDAARYDQASRFFPDNLGKLVLNAEFKPHWRSGPRERFTYRRELGEGRAEFVEVAAATGRRRAAFDHGVVAAGLAKVLGKAVAPDRLPFTDYEESADATILVVVEGKTCTCSLREAACRETQIGRAHV